jgi:hypothetical protein
LGAVKVTCRSHNPTGDNEMKKALRVASGLVMLAFLVTLGSLAPTHLVNAQGVTPYVNPSAQWQTNDNVASIPLGAVQGCGVALTTGAYAANPANSGALVAPAVVRAQAQNNVYQVTTTAAASALTLTCDIVPPDGTRTTFGKGIQITGVQVQYGVQTTALSSITSANTFSTITLPAAGGAASGTVAAISGTPVFNPVLASAQLATTTSGQCYTQTITPATPIVINSQTQRVVFEEVFNQVAGTAAVYQICGVRVFYNNVVF